MEEELYVHYGPFQLIFGCCGYLHSVGILLSWRPPRPSLVSDNISSPLSSMHGLDKVAHVSHVPGFASVGGFGRQAFPAVDRYPAPAPAASVGWAPGSAPATLDGQLSPQSTAISPGSLGDGRRREATLRRRDRLLSPTFAFRPSFGFCGTTVMVVLARRNGCFCPDVRVGTSQLGRRDFRTLETTFPMN